MDYELEGRKPQRLGEGHFVADDAKLIGSVVLHANASVWFGCVLRGDMDELIVGENSNVQDGSVLHTDAGIKLRIGANCTIGHMVMLHGCTIGDNTLIGIRSVVLNGASIGRNSILGAGSVVPEGKTYPDGVLLLGSPAKVVRELSPPEIAMLGAMARHYVQNAARYRNSLKAVAP